MNVRLPVFLGVVTIAAGVAGYRALQPAPKPVFAIASGGESATSAASGGEVAVPNAVVSHRSESPAHVVVYVAGAVKNGGVYALGPHARAVDAVRAAGGTTANADLVAVNLAAIVGDGDEVIVPVKGSPESETAAISAQDAPPRRHRKRRRKRHHRASRSADNGIRTSDGRSESAQTGTASVARDDAGDTGPTAPVDINVADANALESLPGIGSSLAERIVLFREANGPFAAHDDLLDVGGMTQKRLDAIEPFLTSL